METITNIASTVTTTASKAIWGEPNTTQNATQGNETAGKEPVSGELGKGTAAEPYDQGNAATPGLNDNKPLIGNYKDTDSSLSGNNETHTDTPSSISKSTETAPSTLAHTNPTPVGESSTLDSTDKTGVTLKNPEEPLKIPAPTHTLAEIGTEDKKPSTEKPLVDLTKNKDSTTQSSDPLKAQDTTSKTATGTTTGITTGTTTGATTGATALDATKPGAAKEADSLLEEKSAKKTEAATTGATSTSTANATTGTTTKISSNDTHTPEKKEKVHTIDKIKNKLHIGHKDKS